MRVFRGNGILGSERMWKESLVTDILLPAFPKHIVPTSQGFLLMGRTAKTVEARPTVHACVDQTHRKEENIHKYEKNNLFT